MKDFPGTQVAKLTRREMTMVRIIVATLLLSPFLLLVSFLNEGRLSRYPATQPEADTCRQFFDRKDSGGTLCNVCELRVLFFDNIVLESALNAMDKIPFAEAFKRRTPESGTEKQVFTIIPMRNAELRSEQKTVLSALISEIRDVPFGSRLLENSYDSEEIRWSHGDSMSRTLITPIYNSDRRFFALANLKNYRIWEINRKTTRNFYGFVHSDGAASVIGLDHFQNYAEGTLSLVHELFHLRDKKLEEEEKKSSSEEQMSTLEKEFGSEFRANLAEMLFYKEWKERRKQVNCVPQYSRWHEAMLVNGEVSYKEVFDYTLHSLYPVEEVHEWRLIPEKLDVFRISNDLYFYKPVPLQLAGVQNPLNALLARILEIYNGEKKDPLFRDPDQVDMDIVVRAFYRRDLKNQVKEAVKNRSSRAELLQKVSRIAGETNSFEEALEIYLKKRNWIALEFRESGLNSLNEGGPKPRNKGDSD